MGLFFNSKTSNSNASKFNKWSKVGVTKFKSQLRASGMPYSQRQKVTKIMQEAGHSGVKKFSYDKIFRTLGQSGNYRIKQNVKKVLMAKTKNSGLTDQQKRRNIVLSGIDFGSDSPRAGFAGSARKNLGSTPSAQNSLGFKAPPVGFANKSTTGFAGQNR